MTLGGCRYSFQLLGLVKKSRGAPLWTLHENPNGARPCILDCPRLGSLGPSAISNCPSPAALGSILFFFSFFFLTVLLRSSSSFVFPPPFPFLLFFLILLAWPFSLFPFCAHLASPLSLLPPACSLVRRSRLSPFPPDSPNSPSRSAAPTLN